MDKAGALRMKHYPDAPGHNWRDTSILAAEQITESASTLRGMVLALFRAGGTYTTHECAQILGRPVPSIQPRLSELAATGSIIDSGERRRNTVSGKRAIAWKMCAVQLEMF